MVEKVPGWLGRLLLPRLSEMSGEIKALNVRIDSLEKIIGSLRNEMNGFRSEVDIRIDSLEKIIGSLRNEMNGFRSEVATRFDSIEKRMPLMEKLTELEIR